MSPVFWILAGPNGTGKSTFIASGEIQTVVGDVLILNSDRPVTGICRATPREPCSDAVRPTEHLLEEAIEARTSVLVETVLSSEKYNAHVHRARARGFVIGMIYVALPTPELAIRRVRQRVQAGGHDVPLDRIRSSWTQSIECSNVCCRSLTCSAFSTTGRYPTAF